MSTHYEHIWQYLLRHPKLISLFGGINTVLTAIGYISFFLLVFLEILQGKTQLVIESVIVCAVGFIAISLMRTLIDAPRPYEVYKGQTPYSKETCGKSFPSRHTFSLALIALAWIAPLPLVGYILLVLSVVMGVVRVMLGVHWARDIVGAYCLAGIFGIMLFAICSLI